MSFKYRPPKGWPDEIQFTNQLLWDEVPEGYHFFRDKIADPGSVRRSHRTRIERITSRKHPCFGEHGLFADEDIEARVSEVCDSIARLREKESPFRCTLCLPTEYPPRLARRSSTTPATCAWSSATSMTRVRRRTFSASSRMMSRLCSSTLTRRTRATRRGSPT